MIEKNHNVCFKVLNKNSNLLINNLIHTQNFISNSNNVHFNKNDLDHSKYTHESICSEKENKNIFKEIKLYNFIKKLIHIEIKNNKRKFDKINLKLEKLKLDYLEISLKKDDILSKYEIKFLEEKVYCDSLGDIEGNKNNILKKFDLNEDNLKSCLY